MRKTAKNKTKKRKRTNSLLSSKDKHELLQSLFVSAIKKSFQKKQSKNNFPFAEQVVVKSNNKDIQTGLAKAEEKIGKALKTSVTGNDKDEDEVGSGSEFPNLKYAEPKYKNVESVLKYVETPDDKSGVKLVIMNFND